VGARAGSRWQPRSSHQAFLTPFSHLEYYWDGTREECLSRGNYIIAKAIKLAKESPQFRFLLEEKGCGANFMETHEGRPESEDLKGLVKQGQIEIAPKRATIFSGLPASRATERAPSFTCRKMARHPAGCESGGARWRLIDRSGVGCGTGTCERPGQMLAQRRGDNSTCARPVPPSRTIAARAGG
jgi:hypothetical protein